MDKHCRLRIGDGWCCRSVAASGGEERKLPTYLRSLQHWRLTAPWTTTSTPRTSAGLYLGHRYTRQKHHVSVSSDFATVSRLKPLQFPSCGCWVVPLAQTHARCRTCCGPSRPRSPSSGTDVVLLLRHRTQTRQR